jgi:hypothetical protein
MVTREDPGKDEIDTGSRKERKGTLLPCEMALAFTSKGILNATDTKHNND